jgi:hypothetical protein
MSDDSDGGMRWFAEVGQQEEMEYEQRRIAATEKAIPRESSKPTAEAIKEGFAEGQL